uniref:Si:dkey-6n6.1 n=1 Tax=Astyanax mexicanus TaxID=7994 RepID=A0A8B9H152_ASTMX
MSRPIAYLCVWVCVCAVISDADGRRGTRKGEKHKNRFDPAAGYNTPAHPVTSTQCLVNGILLFEGAAWSPDACNVCQCKGGAVSCHAVPCLVTAPPASRPAVKQQKTPSGEKLEKKGKGKNIRQPNGTGKTVPEVHPKVTISQAKTVKLSPAPPKKVPTPKVEVGKPQWGDRKPPVVQSPDLVPGLGVVERRRFDHDDHDDDDHVEDDSDSDDDDDDDVGVFLNTSPNSHIDRLASAHRVPSTDTMASAGRAAPAHRMPSTSILAPAGREAPVHRVPSNSKPAVVPAQKPALLPSQRSFAPPTRQSVVLPPSNPLPVPGGRSVAPGRPAYPQYVHMESLPAGCLLSESLIACGSTGLTHLPLLKDAGVRTLYLADNKISKMPSRSLSGLPNLEWLDLSKNKLDDSSLGLDVFRNLTKLRRLILDGNNLTKVPALPPSLLELKINDNRLSGLTPHSFRGLSQLLTLELEDNHFHDGNVSPLAFRNLGKLIYLRLDDNDFRAIPSSLPTSLQELHLSDNRIEVVHAGLLNKTVHLRVLNLSHNKIREDRIAPRAWFHLRKLESLDLSYNKLVHVPSFLPVGLRQLTLHHNQIERIPGYVFGHLKPGLDSLHLSYNRLREDGVSEVSFHGLYHSLTELLLDHNQLRSIPRGIIQLRALQLLRLNHNYISSVPMNSLCDSMSREDSPLLSVHLQYNLIDRRLIPHTALSCIKTYHSVVLRPQKHEQIYE